MRALWTLRWALLTANAHSRFQPTPEATPWCLDELATTIQSIRVPMVSVRSILQSQGWNKIDLLKVDIEGYERTLFGSDAGWLKVVGHIVGEVHGHVHYDLPDLERDLGPYGFECRITRRMEGAAMFEASRRHDLWKTE